MRSLLFVPVLFLVGLVGMPTSGAQSLDDVSVVIEPTARTVVLGESFDLRITVTNDGTEPTVPVVVHIDVTDPATSTSVDPEDWTATLSKRAGVLAPGSTIDVDWNIQPISAGSFALYAVALSPEADTVAASNVLVVDVLDQRSLNPGGILPVAIGAPLVVAALLVTQLRTARRAPRREFLRASR